MLSDETSSDSDSGIRFKTQSTRSTKDNRGTDRPQRREGRDRPGDRRFDTGRHDRDRVRHGRGTGGRAQREVETQRNRDREEASRRTEHRHSTRDSRPDDRERRSDDRDRRSDDRERRSDDRFRELERRRETPRTHEKSETERRRSPDRNVQRKVSLDRDRSRSGHRRDRPRLQEGFGRDFRAEIRKNIAGNNRDGRQKETNDKHRPGHRDMEPVRSLSSSISNRDNRDDRRHEKAKSVQQERISHSRSKEPSRRRSSPIRIASRERSSLRGNTSDREQIPAKTECVKSHRSTISKSPLRSKHEKREVVVEDESIKKESSLNIHRSKSSSEQEEQPTSYYNIIPNVESVKAVEEPLSISDSSEDEETLRAKLLHLEKELKKTKKKKEVKKKPKKVRKSKKSKSPDREQSPVEQSVSSTTDIKVGDVEKATSSGSLSLIGSEAITTSTGNKKKAGAQEGELSSDTDNGHIEINDSDLRHRLRKSEQHGAEKETLKSVSGPALPPHMQAAAVEGPALPPHLSRSKNIGPTLPTDMRKILAESGRPIPHDETSSSSDDGIGPLPAGTESRWTDAHESLERRALQMKMSRLEGGGTTDEGIAREEWMLELPDAKAKIIGIGPRQFRSKEGPDMSDRSSWTDTPKDKALKVAGVQSSKKQEVSTEALQQDARQTFIQERDLQQEKAVKKHKKKHKREESLMELHEKKLKKKKKKEEKESDGVKVRRPFDRNVDLQANRFDDAQKQALIKKAQHLDSKFSSGEAKFL